jgi:hypothetical protein
MRRKSKRAVLSGTAVKNTCGNVLGFGHVVERFTRRTN